MTADELHVVVETTDDGVVLIRVRGSLDGWSGSEDLVRALDGASAQGRRLTVADLSQLEFADSTGLHTLLNAHQRHTEAGVPLVLAGPFMIGVQRLFEVSGTQDAFRFADTVDAALTC
ncbi:MULTISPECIES: STAS domain-containing protein [Streptomyces]|uniref:Anti-anti-sigma factor n=1 Tax=Streptomyces clavifer TaxID=68188 RepID=A0ABS4VA67_9ACTN|nr:MULTISPECIES: STAS domain-containing protein [Streptomyces]KQX90834.1 anti-anti-sigma factor [Streptomyces sp. Root1319]KQZ03529.1 anti-anti-sigma factor [Streptomyces sp. Root55]MBP2360728.1 anti-anti-sigma factor [Streptomyces clavifer]MDX2746096.1 STAS domain-containing protein [Streptomyces sp. NRRL_B-2557]MDX3064208.1 STAS domain-containing protein [Streptomyces sp. ND04-05B]